MTSSGSTVKTRVFCISDTHQGYPRDEVYSDTGAFRPPFPQGIDILLHSGDITMFGLMKEYQDSLKMFRDIHAELKLVIAGNHDLSLHESYWLNDRDSSGRLQVGNVLAYGGYDYEADLAKRSRELWTGSEAKKAGITYLDEGLYTFDLKNGARFAIYVSPWQPAFGDWAFNYPHREDRWNPPEYIAGSNANPAPKERDPHPIPMNAHVDLMMTHGPAYSHLDMTSGRTRAGCPHLLRALDRVRPRLHCSGHIHEAWGGERITWRTSSSGTAANTPVGEFGETTEIIGGTDKGHMGVTSETTGVIRPQDTPVVDQRAVHIDVSANSPRPLEFGAETLLINASVVNLNYKTTNAGWLVDLELPKKPQDSKPQI